MLDRFQKTLLGTLNGSGAHVPPMRALEHLTALQARLRVQERVPTVWELLRHIAEHQDNALDRLEQVSTTAQDTPGYAVPSFGPDSPEAEWNELVDRFEAGLWRATSFGQSKDLALKVKGMSEATYGGVLLALSEHNSYHIGQIVMLRRILNLWPPPAETASR